MNTKPKSYLKEFCESVSLQQVLPVVTIETPIAVAVARRVQSLLDASSRGGQKSRKPKRKVRRKVSKLRGALEDSVE